MKGSKKQWNYPNPKHAFGSPIRVENLRKSDYLEMDISPIG